MLAIKERIFALRQDTAGQMHINVRNYAGLLTCLLSTRHTNVSCEYVIWTHTIHGRIADNVTYTFMITYVLLINL